MRERYRRVMCYPCSLRQRIDDILARSAEYGKSRDGSESGERWGVSRIIHIFDTKVEAIQPVYGLRF